MHAASDKPVAVPGGRHYMTDFRR